MVGYSGTPLPRKLGIKPGTTVALVAAPDDFEATLGELPDGVSLTGAPEGEADVVVVFGTTRSDMEARFRAAMARIPADGAIWVAWPKQSSGVATELTGNVVRELLLPTGLVDTKVCAIDETWSGLRFVVRTDDREAWPR